MAAIDRIIASGANRVGLSRAAVAWMVKARRSLAHLGSVRERRQLARTLADHSAWTTFMPQERGYALLDTARFPGLDDAVAAGRRIVAEREAAALRGFESAKKPFFFNVLNHDDLTRWPALLGFALSPAIVEAATAYLGTLPRLHGFGVYLSGTNDSTISSQEFHRDEDAFHQVKCFINLEDVGPDTGPFTFLPAAVTERVCRAVGRGWGSGRYSDAEVLAAAAPDAPIALTGPAGTGALVDTSRCLHFGSRTRHGRRAVLMFQFLPVPDVLLDKDKAYPAGYPLMEFPRAAAGDGVRALVLAPRG